MAILLAKLEVQGWSHLFLQGDSQRKFEKFEVYEFYTNGSKSGDYFSTTMRGVSIHLVKGEISIILDIPMVGWGHYVKFRRTSLDNLA